MSDWAFVAAAFVCILLVAHLSLGWLPLSDGRRSLVALGYELVVVAGTLLIARVDSGKFLGLALLSGGPAVVVIAIRGVHLASRSLKHEVGWGIGIFGLLGNLATLIYGVVLVLVFIGIAGMH